MPESNEWEPAYKRWEERFGKGKKVKVSVIKIDLDKLMSTLKKIFGGAK